MKLPEGELVSATRQAIADATDFDERQMKHNFEYDRRAYETIKRDFGRLINAGLVDEAMKGK